MLKIVKVVCPHCHGQEEFKIGTSYRDSKYNLLNQKNEICVINKVKDKKEKEKIRSILKHGGELMDGYGYKLYTCKECNFLCSEYYFDIRIGHDKYVPEYFCPSCKKTLERLDDKKMVDYTCPSCHKESMNYIQM